MLSYLGEVEERRLDLQAACSSLFDFCDHPRRRVHGSDTALRALTAMGFKPQQVRHSLGMLCERWAGATPPLETLLRESLSILT